MLGMITCTGNRARLYRDEHTDFPLLHLELRKPGRSRRALRALERAGVTRVIVSSELMKLIAPTLERTGMELVKTSSMLRRLCPYLAVAAARDLGLCLKNLGAEIYAGSGGTDAQNAAVAVGGKVRYLSIHGRGADPPRRAAAQVLGISVLDAPIPAALCTGKLHLYFDGSDALFRIQTPGNGIQEYAGVELELPERYRALSRPGCVLQLAAALAEIGRLRLEELRIRRVLLEQGEI